MVGEWSLFMMFNHWIKSLDKFQALIQMKDANSGAQAKLVNSKEFVVVFS